MSTFNSNEAAAMRVVRRLGAVTVLVIAGTHAMAGEGMATTAQADPATVAMRQLLQSRYPKTQFGDINRTAVTGIWEVWMGANVAYTTDEGRYFLFGHLFDMQTQSDLTAKAKASAVPQAQASEGPTQTPKLAFADLPLNHAIRTVRGTGERKLAVFADPDCGYCRQLESTLAKMKNVTVYTFLLPFQPGSAAKADAIWCSKDRSAAWAAYMNTGRTPTATRCETPVQAITELAQRAGVSGTPTIFFANGDRVAGALDAAAIERRMAAN